MVIPDDAESTIVSLNALTPVDKAQLSTFNLVLYKFGLFIVDLLATRNGHRPVTLLMASSVPGT